MPRSKREVNREKMYEKIMPSLARIADVQGEIQEVKKQEPQKEEQFKLVNISYELILARVNEVMERFKCCKCDRCKKDVIAIALNTLPSKYIVCEDKKTAVLSRGTQTAIAEVSSALVQAIIKVKSNPRH